MWYVQLLQLNKNSACICRTACIGWHMVLRKVRWSDIVWGFILGSCLRFLKTVLCGWGVGRQTWSGAAGTYRRKLKYCWCVCLTVTILWCVDESLRMSHLHTESKKHTVLYSENSYGGGIVMWQSNSSSAKEDAAASLQETKPTQFANSHNFSILAFKDNKEHESRR